MVLGCSGGWMVDLLCSLERERERELWPVREKIK